MSKSQKKANNNISTVDVALDMIYPVNEDIMKAVNVSVEQYHANTMDILSSESYSERYYSNKSNEHNTWKYILGGLIILIFIIGILILFYYISNNNNSTSDDSTDSDTSQTDENIGAMIPSSDYYILGGKAVRNISNKPRIILPDRKSLLYYLNNTDCQYGYYGDSCQYQVNSPFYYNIGDFQMTYTKQSLGEMPLSLNYDASNGATSKNSCTGNCDNINGCKGVEYNHETKECNLIISEVQGTGSVVMNYSKPEQIYLKRNYSPHFTDVVYGFYGSKYLRYYLINNQIVPIKREIGKNKGKVGTSRGLIKFIPNVPVNLSWCPQKIANFNGYVGIYSTSEFNETNWKESTIVYIDNSIGEYKLPISLQKYNNIYIMYIPSSEYTK